MFGRTSVERRLNDTRNPSRQHPPQLRHAFLNLRFQLRQFIQDQQRRIVLHFCVDNLLVAVDAQVVVVPGNLRLGHQKGLLAALAVGFGGALLPAGQNVGDVLMGGYLGGNLLSTKPTYHYFAEDMTQIQSSLAFLLAQPLHTFYVGHGGPLRAEQVRAAFEGSALTARYMSTLYYR